MLSENGTVTENLDFSRVDAISGSALCKPVHIANGLERKKTRLRAVSHVPVIAFSNVSSSYQPTNCPAFIDELSSSRATSHVASLPFVVSAVEKFPWTRKHFLENCDAARTTGRSSTLKVIDAVACVLLGQCWGVA